MFTLFRNFADLCLKNYPFFLISRLPLKTYPLFLKMGAIMDVRFGRDCWWWARVGVGYDCTTNHCQYDLCMWLDCPSWAVTTWRGVRESPRGRIPRTRLQCWIYVICLLGIVTSIHTGWHQGPTLVTAPHTLYHPVTARNIWRILFILVQP